MNPTEGKPQLESENVCERCKEPQMIPLNHNGHCLNCFVFLERSKS